MLSKKLIVLFMILTPTCFHAVANNPIQKQSKKPEVLVSTYERLENGQYKQSFEIYAESSAVGYTLEEAKLAAYSKLVPDLVAKTQNIHSYVGSSNFQGVITERGRNQIAGQTYISGYWEMKDSIYEYTLEIMVSNDK